MASSNNELDFNKFKFFDTKENNNKLLPGNILQPLTVSDWDSIQHLSKGSAYNPFMKQKPKSFVSSSEFYSMSDKKEKPQMKTKLAKSANSKKNSSFTSESSCSNSVTRVPTSNESSISSKILEKEFLKNSSFGSDTTQNEDKFVSLLKGGDSSSSEKPLAVAADEFGIIKKKSIVKSYHRYFQIIGFVTILIFFCPILSSVMEISCFLSQDYCMPLYEIQTSGVPLKIEQNYFKQFFSMNNATNSSNEISLVLGRDFLKSFSTSILGSGFSSETITNVLANIFQNKRNVIYQLNQLGYCKNNEDKYICHSNFGNSFDLFTIIFKDIIYELTLKEKDDDAEKLSNFSVNKYHEILKEIPLKNGPSNQFLIFGYLSNMFSKAGIIAVGVHIGLDFLCLIFSIIITIYLRGKSKYKYNSSTGEKIHMSYNKHFGIKAKNIGFIIGLISIFLTYSMIIQTLTLFYQVVYLKRIEKFMSISNLHLIRGIRLLGSGSIIELVNIGIHFLIICILISVLLVKPWIIKII